MRKLFIICALVFLTAPSFVMAAASTSPKDFYPIIQCSTAANPEPCTPCELFVQLERVINFILFGVTGPVAVFMIILSGGMILLGAGNPTALSKGKDLFKSTILGVAVILLSWVATTFLLQALTNSDGSWYEVSCPAFLSEIPTPKDLTILPLTEPAKVSTAVDLSEGVHVIPLTAMSSARINVCSTTAPVGGCAAVKCPKYQSFISSVAGTVGGAATASAIESIMFYESSCNVKAKSLVGAYGLMQLLPATANQFREGCVKPDPKDGQIKDMPINGGWLQDERHAEESICIAAKFINSLVGECGTDPRNIIAGYNGGGQGTEKKPGACRLSRDCSEKSCGGGAMRAWECPWDNKDHTAENTGFNETREYVPKVIACIK